MINKTFNKIKRWPIEKKRIFSLLGAIFLTILIIILNFGINLIWKKDEISNKNLAKNNPFNSIQDSFSKIFNEAQPALDQAFNMLEVSKKVGIEQASSSSDGSSSTDLIIEQTGETIDQASSTTSTSSLIESE